MNLTGTLHLGVPPEVAVAGFHDPATLETFVPGGSTLTPTGPASFSFEVVRETSLLTLRLPGNLTIAPEGAGYRFVAKARHMLGGSAALSLLLEFSPKDRGCTLRYDGTLESSGLVDRLLRDRTGQVEHAVSTRFAAVKARLESRPLA